MTTVHLRTPSRISLAAFYLLLGTALGLGQPLVWDAVSKSYSAKPGETNALFRFSVTNASSTEITINSVRTSCGCTVAKLPVLPWRLAPGTKGDIEVDLDLRGKRGTLTKTVSVDSTAGFAVLMVAANIPEPSERERNQMLALGDRQAIFRNDCASCHARPAEGKKGFALFQAACAICHEAEHRASMVPDLRVVGKVTPADYWRMWVTQGKPGSLMPGFAKAEGGPLDDEQIKSLVDYLANHYPPAEGGTSKTDALDPALSGLPLSDR
jgi:cytochrome c553